MPSVVKQCPSCGLVLAASAPPPTRIARTSASLAELARFVSRYQEHNDKVQRALEKVRTVRS